MNQTPETPNSRAALFRLLIVLLVALGFTIYAYGVETTDIDLDKPQEEQRQTNTQNALRELLSPNIFEQDRELRELTANFQVGCEEGAVIEQPENSEGVLEISPDCGEVGDVVSITVRGLPSRVDARIRWDPPGEDSQTRPREVLETGREEFILDRTGSFSGTIEVPRVRGIEDGMSQIRVLAAVPVGSIRFSDTTDQVIFRMAETVFMALVATSVAIPLAALISFFAARNLMQPIKLSAGTLLLAVIALALGAYLGQLLLQPLADLGVELGRGDENGALPGLAALILVPVALSVFFRYLASSGLGDNHLVNLLTRIVMLLAVIFMIGLIGGFALLGGDQIIILADNIRPDFEQVATDLSDNILTVPLTWVLKAIPNSIGAIGNLLQVLGELVELFTLPIVALGTGTVLAGIALDLLAAPLRRLPKPAGHILGAVMGAISGALLFAVTGTFGTWAALLGLISPIVAALIGGQALVMAYRELVPRDMRARRYNVNRTDDLLRLVLFWVGAVAAFIVTALFLNLRIAIVNGTLPSDVTIEFLGMSMRRYVFDNLVVGAVLGGLSGGISGTHHSFPFGSALYNVARILLNTVRSIEPLIMGLVFVVWVGIGPFAGVLALTLHSIASLGKLYSEQVESIDTGPVEALDSTGASRLQTIIYAVVPQIVPPYIAFTMYRWDINVRMSTIIGFVGGGGIGLLLQQQINLLRYRDAGVAVLAIAIVVSILDYASASIRERIM